MGVVIKENTEVEGVNVSGCVRRPLLENADVPLQERRQCFLDRFGHLVEHGLVLCQEERQRLCLDQLLESTRLPNRLPSIPGRMRLPGLKPWAPRVPKVSLGLLPLKGFQVEVNESTIPCGVLQGQGSMTKTMSTLGGKVKEWQKGKTWSILSLEKQ